MYICTFMHDLSNHMYYIFNVLCLAAHVVVSNIKLIKSYNSKIFYMYMYVTLTNTMYTCTHIRANKLKQTITIKNNNKYKCLNLLSS